MFVPKYISCFLPKSKHIFLQPVDSGYISEEECKIEQELINNTSKLLKEQMESKEDSSEKNSSEDSLIEQNLNDSEEKKKEEESLSNGSSKILLSNYIICDENEIKKTKLRILQKYLL